MPTIAELGRLAAAHTIKQASTALVRHMAKGLLAPKTIQRAASAMPEGKFRFVKNLGRGQFSLADQVVGNVGGKAGQMVRKLPTHADMTPTQEYQPVKQLVDHYNTKYKGWFGGQPIAPYHAVSDQGAFQALANARVRPARKLTRQLSDLHEGNIGPKGQIIDFGLGSQASQTNTMAMNYARPRIDPSSMIQSGKAHGYDLLGNIGSASPATQQALAPFNSQINNNIRRYWNTSQQARPQFLQNVHAQAPQRANQIIQAQQSANSTDLYRRGMAETAPMGKKPFGAWTDFKTEPAPYLFTGGVGAAGLGAGGYGVYNHLRK